MKQGHGVFLKDHEKFTEPERKSAPQICRKPFLHFNSAFQAANSTPAREHYLSVEGYADSLPVLFLYLLA